MRAKTVNEAQNFKRGQNPHEALNVGLYSKLPLPLNLLNVVSGTYIVGLEYYNGYLWELIGFKKGFNGRYILSQSGPQPPGNITWDIKKFFLPHIEMPEYYASGRSSKLTVRNGDPEGALMKGEGSAKESSFGNAYMQFVDDFSDFDDPIEKKANIRASESSENIAFS